MFWTLSPVPGPVLSSSPLQEGELRGSGWLLLLFLLLQAKLTSIGQLRSVCQNKDVAPVGILVSPEAQIKCIPKLCAMNHGTPVLGRHDPTFLPPCILKPFLKRRFLYPSHLWLVTPGSASCLQPLSSYPSLPHSPLSDHSGSLLPGDICKENEVIYIIKTNWLLSVRIHCGGRMDLFRGFVRRKARGLGDCSPSLEM